MSSVLVFTGRIHPYRTDLVTGSSSSSSEINWHNLVQTVIVPAVLSPLIAGGVAALGT